MKNEFSRQSAGYRCHEGGVYATRGQAVESFDGEEGFVRYVEDLEEQKSIWRDIYRTEIERDGSYAEDCERWLKTLDADLESMWAG